MPESARKNAPGSCDPGAFCGFQWLDDYGRDWLGGSLALPIAAFGLQNAALGHLDGGGAGALLAFAYFVGDGLAFGELLDLDAAEFRVVEKQVVTPGGDEPESLFGDNFLDGTFWHFCSPENTKHLAGAAFRSRGSASTEN
jgi:hypothetical protein